MDPETKITGLYNRAKNSNNHINYNNPLSKKANILNINSINFLYNKTNESENKNDYNNEISMKIDSNMNIINNNESNKKLTLPKINEKFHVINKKNNVSNNFQNNKILLSNNSKEDDIDIKPSGKPINSTRITSSNTKLNKTNQNTINSKNKINQNSNMNEDIVKPKKNILHEETTKKAPVQPKKVTVRKFKSNILKEFLNQSSIKSIQLFLDPKSLKNFILACKKFYLYSLSNDDLWFYYYCKKYKIESTKDKYNQNRSKWREVFLNSIKKIFDQNYDKIKHKFLKNFNMNKYQVSKDPYNIPNLIYNYMKPTYSIEIDGKLFKVKHIFTNKILSHINFFINFDQEYLDSRKANRIKLYLNEKNLGFSDVKIFEIELKKKKFINLENEGIRSKICNIFAYKEMIFSTFEKNYIFFINISLPICKICEIAFDFLKGLHGKNLSYEDDITKDFGLYDYVLLINIKSWKDIFFTLHVNKMDFKKDNEEDYLRYENESRSKNIIFI